MKILYVTSFAKDMYNATGKRLIDSFIQTKQKGNLLVCYENFDFKSNYKNIHTYNIGEYKFLLEWLNNNKYIIPKYQGGCATEESCPKAFTPPNRRASRWFRKIAALHYALNIYSNNNTIENNNNTIENNNNSIENNNNSIENNTSITGYKYDMIVWVDSDCYFKKYIDMKLYKIAFNKTEIFYHLGLIRDKRKLGIESGFIGFRNINDTFNFLNILFETYSTEKFIQYDRWDDGYVMKMIVQDNNYNINGNDLIIQNINSKHSRNIISKGMFHNYISHNKGVHSELNILI
jgi:hypothetical protein